MDSKYYFSSPEKVIKLKAILDSWITPHTPFRHRCGVKGLGADCIHFCAKVFDELGILDFNLIKFPAYDPSWHLHNTREQLYEGVFKYLKLEKVDMLNLEDGDLLLGHYGQAASHASVYLGGYLYHSLNQIGVVKEEYKNSK